MVVSLFSCLFGIDRQNSRIEKLAQPYQQAMQFVASLDSVSHVNDHDIFIFFNKYGFYKKQDITKLHRTVRILKNMMAVKKLSQEAQAKAAVFVYDLEKVASFVADYAPTYQGLITYYEIAAYYYYIDEQHAHVVDFLLEQSEKIGLPNMHKRGLYKFVKKIDLDLRRLTALFAQEIISDDLVVKMNQTKTKLLILKSKVVMSSQYKYQLSKTRWLKAFGIILLPISIGLTCGLIAVIYGSHVLTTNVFIGTVSSVAMLGFLGAVIGITAQELEESTKYNIPVHSTSLFSLFRPDFSLFTWIPRG